MYGLWGALIGSSLVHRATRRRVEVARSKIMLRSLLVHHYTLCGQGVSAWQAIMGLHLDQLCGRLKKSVVSERLLTSSVLQVEAQKGRLAPYSQSTSRRISTHRKRPVPVAAV